MKVIIGNQQKLISDSALVKTESKIIAAFARYGTNIVKVELTVEDVNGTRGGEDKECRIVVKLKKMDSVVVTARNVSVSKAIAQTIHRAERSVSRKIEKRQMHPSRLTVRPNQL